MTTPRTHIAAASTALLVGLLILPGAAGAAVPADAPTALEPLAGVLDPVTQSLDAALPAPLLTPVVEHADATATSVVDTVLADVVAPLPIVGASTSDVVRPIARLQLAPEPDPRAAQPSIPAASISATTAPSDPPRDTALAVTLIQPAMATRRERTGVATTAVPLLVQLRTAGAARPQDDREHALALAVGTDQAPPPTPVKNDRGASATPAATPLALGTSARLPEPPSSSARAHVIAVPARPPPRREIPVSPD
ncbi:MAG: hypothetical protein JWM90_1779 [Thermoleophilia bacterium]|nr:hypothetical protein [Thermoleophilia bacterium]